MIYMLLQIIMTVSAILIFGSLCFVAGYLAHQIINRLPTASEPAGPVKMPPIASGPRPSKPVVIQSGSVITLSEARELELELGEDSE
jgi:hypothetical protein